MGVWGCLLQGVSAPGGGVVSQHALRQTPPVNRMTDMSKNITLATTKLWPVKMFVVNSLSIEFLTQIQIIK